MVYLIINFIQQHERFDDVITMTHLRRHCLFSVTLRWEIKTPSIFLKFGIGGKIEKLIMKMS